MKNSKIMLAFISLLSVALFTAQQGVYMNGVFVKSGGGQVPATYTFGQLYTTNTNIDKGTDDCAAFFTSTRTQCIFTVTGIQKAGSFIIIMMNAQDVSIAANQAISATDTLGNTYVNPVSCPEFFSGNSKTSNCLIVTNAVGGGIPTITLTVSVPVGVIERIGTVYAEAFPIAGAGTGTMSGPAAKINITTSCGAPGSPCNGPASTDFSLTGTSLFCVEAIINGPTQASVSSPWNTYYGNNGDHSAFAAVVNFPNSFTGAQFTAASSSNAIAEGVCAQ